MQINSENSLSDFQLDLNRFYSKCMDNGLDVNVSKCTQITFTLRQTNEVFNYKIDQFKSVVSQVKIFEDIAF